MKQSILFLFNSPKFVTSIKIPFVFSEIQTLKFEVYDTNQFDLPTEEISFFYINIINI